MHRTVYPKAERKLNRTKSKENENKKEGKNRLVIFSIWPGWHIWLLGHTAAYCQLKFQLNVNNGMAAGLICSNGCLHFGCAAVCLCNRSILLPECANVSLNAHNSEIIFNVYFRSVSKQSIFSGGFEMRAKSNGIVRELIGSKKVWVKVALEITWNGIMNPFIEGVHYFMYDCTLFAFVITNGLNKQISILVGHVSIYYAFQRFPCRHFSCQPASKGSAHGLSVIHF